MRAEIEASARHGDIAVDVGQMPQRGDCRCACGRLKAQHLLRFIHGTAEQAVDQHLTHAFKAKHGKIRHAAQIVQ